MDEALRRAAECGDAGFIRTCPRDLDEKDESGNTALLIALSRGHTGTVQALLEAKADPNLAGGTFGWPPLILAAYTGQAEAVRMLVQAGADLNQTDGSGNTALITSARKEKREVVELLLKAGADVNHRNASGKTALELTEDMKTSDLLEEYGAK